MQHVKISLPGMITPFERYIPGPATRTRTTEMAKSNRKINVLPSEKAKSAYKGYHRARS